MSQSTDFFREIDAKWARSPKTGLELNVIGSTALMMTTDLRLGTTDSDVIRTAQIDDAVMKRLLEIAGRGSDAEKKFGLHLQFVPRGLPFLPQGPKYLPVGELTDLKFIRVFALAPVDVAISKLKVFRPHDVRDIAELIEAGHIVHEEFLARFRSAIDLAGMSSRADDIPKIVEHFHQVERNDFGLEAPSRVDLPDHLEQ